MPWSRPGFAADRALRAVLAAGTKHRRHVRAAALINRLRGTEVSQIKALASRRASARGYLHIGSRPAVFVALADRAQRDCAGGAALASSSSRLLAGPGDVRRLRAVQQRRQRVVLRPPTRIQRTSPWHVPDPAGLPAQACEEIAIAALAHAWRRAVARMNASGARLQLIDSLNGWGNGTAIGPSSAWRSRSRFGRYLDALHAHSPRHARRADLPDRRGSGADLA